MRKKKLLLISLQLTVVAGFVLMALASSSGRAVVSPDIKRMNRATCNSADLVFFGQYENQGQCGQTCRSNGFKDFCFSGGSCFCK